MNMNDDSSTLTLSMNYLVSSFFWFRVSFFLFIRDVTTVLKLTQQIKYIFLTSRFVFQIGFGALLLQINLNVSRCGW